MAHPSLKHLKKDKAFATLIKKHGEPQLERNLKPFEAFVRAIIYQQVSGAAAATILRRFLELFPPTSPRLRRASKFPTPEMVLAMPMDKLRGAGVSAQKASYIKDLAEKFSNGTVKPRSFAKMTNEEVIAHVTQVKGIGVWTAHMFLLFTLGRLDILPTGDLGVQKGFQILYKLKKLPTHDQMERLAKDWRPHASAASWYLWRVADEASPARQKLLKKQTIDIK